MEEKGILAMGKVRDGLVLFEQKNWTKAVRPVEKETAQQWLNNTVHGITIATGDLTLKDVDEHSIFSITKCVF